jgi:ABC-type uncharacterized transport system permease subunit
MYKQQTKTSHISQPLPPLFSIERRMLNLCFNIADVHNKEKRHFKM